MQVSHDLIFEFKRDGKDTGFHACKDQYFIFKPTRETAVTIPLETLKKNLRLMVRTKRAKILKVGIVEAVVVPKQEFINLFI